MNSVSHSLTFSYLMNSSAGACPPWVGHVRNHQLTRLKGNFSCPLFQTTCSSLTKATAKATQIKGCVLKGRGQANLLAVDLAYTRSFPSSTVKMLLLVVPLETSQLRFLSLLCKVRSGVGCDLPSVSELALAQAC